MMNGVKRIVILWTLIALLVGACGTTPEVPTPTPSALPPQSTATASPPTPAVPTATPLPLPAPRLLPAPAGEVALDAPFEITFDQPMDRESVEAAFSISPAVEGTLEWDGERTLVFVPGSGAGFERSTRYTVTIGEEALNIEGTPLEEAAQLEFETVGELAVTQVVPAPGTQDLDPDTTVTVVFNRPVVPLTTIARQGELPDPLTFVPPVRGEGEWLNTSIYLFRPAGGFLPATQYKARVAAGLTDVTGAVLAEDYTWEFETILPAVMRLWPPGDFQYMGPTEAISVTFNQPMDHDSVEAHFTLVEVDNGSSAPLAGRFRWLGGETPLSAETMLFEPAEPLPRDTHFEVQVAEGAMAATGGAGLAGDHEWGFRTVRPAGVAGTSPSNGARDVEPERYFEITFASPMQVEGFLDHVSIRPAVTEVYTYWSQYDTEVKIYFEQEPQTTYRVTLDPSTPDKFGQVLGEAARVSFTTGDLMPFASLQTVDRIGTYSTYTDTLLYASYRNVTRLELSLYRLSVVDFMRMNSDWEVMNVYGPGRGDLVRRWSRKVAGDRNEVHLATFELALEGGEALPPGAYFVQLDAPQVREAYPRSYEPSRFVLVKSALNLTLKQTREEALVWATDQSSGEPVAGLPVTFYTRWGDPDAQATTDADGLALVDGLQDKDLWDPFFAVSGEPGEETFAVVYNGWDRGISPWDYDVESEFWATDYQAYMYTDRPIYRPGQTVYFKGILRTDDDANYRVPDDLGRVAVHVYDPQGKELYTEELALNDMGTLHDELVLDEEAALGGYWVEIQEPEHELYAGTTFQVAEYRAPEFQVAVQVAQDAVLAGETIQATAEATYYFGGPVAGADLQWSALSSDYFFRYECPQGKACPPYSWTDYEWGDWGWDEYDYGSLVAQGEAETGDDGRVTFRVPTDLSEETQSQLYTIEASVTDINGQQVSNRTAAVVHKGEFYVGVAPRGYLAEVGDEKEVELLAVDWDGEPVEGAELTVVFMEHNWFSTRREAEDGNFYWEWVARDEPVLTTTVTTDADGQAVAGFTPRKAGSYRVRAIGVDGHENEIRSSAYFWVWGGSETVSWRRESNNRIELIADKDEYEVGDVAEVLVPSPFTGTVQALVTVERGHILDVDVLEIEGNSTVLRVPIVEAHVPNVFVSVVLVQGAGPGYGLGPGDLASQGLADFKMGLIKLPVSLETKELEITLTPDKEMDEGEHYGPRQTAVYDVLVTDHAGEPVEAELSLRLADLAVLALADEPGGTLLNTFWRGRGLGVKTSLPLVVAMERFNQEVRARAKGGGGGEDGGLVRSRFADTAFWDPVVRTDEEGRAQVEVALPDNLTTWRMQARGITADTLVGRAEVDVLSTLDLLVRPVLPRFFVVGDRAEIATVVHNNTAEALDVRVNVSAEGLALPAETSREVQVPAGDKVRVDWPVEVMPGTGVSVRMWASAGDLYDGREDALPVYRYVTPEVMATAGRLSEPETRQEVVQLSPAVDAQQGELTVRIEGSLTAAAGEALDYLKHYPYECTEQTVSRFLPNVLTWQALDEFEGVEIEGQDREALRQQLAQMVGIALQRLYANQHYDGGWGWWVNDKSNAYITAYALHGLVEAQRAGFGVDTDVMDRGAAYLRENLPSVGRVDTYWEANRLAYTLYVLAEYGDLTDSASASRRQGELGVAVSLFEKRDLLSRYGQATLAVALSLLEPDERERVDTLLSDLAGDAVLSATGAHWEEAEPDYWNMNTDIRTTAIVVWALSRLDPENDLLPGAVRWLMAVRQDGHWESTQETAWALMGLVEYMRASGELRGDYGYRVTLNGQELASGNVTAENLSEGRELRVDIARLLEEEANRLVIERLEPAAGQTGEGQLYYSASLRYTLPADHVQALEQGIMVARQYAPMDVTGDAPARYVDTAQVGDVIQVKLTIVAPNDLYYVVVEDPLPAGFEGVDMSLNTTSVVGEAPELRNLTAEEESTWYRRYGWGWWWFSHTEMRDEKVVLFANYLPRGTYEYTYLMRAGVAGEFYVLPSTAYEMYFPEVFGRSDGGKFTVTGE